MTNFEEDDNIIFTLPTSLSLEDYEIADKMFKKNEMKNCSIYFQNKFVDKLQFIYAQDKDICNLFQNESKFNIEIPETSRIELIPLIIHYLYFKEIRAIPFGEIANFLDLAAFFQMKDLIKKIINHLKGTIDTARKAVMLRISLFPLTKTSDLDVSASLNEFIAICETYLLTNNHMKEYLSFYKQDYFLRIHNDSDIESYLLNELEMMKKHRTNGKYMLRLLVLFKNHLCMNKNKHNKFDFKVYAEGIINKYVKLGEISNKSLIKSLALLELNLKDLKISRANENAAELENEIKSLKEIIEELYNKKKNCHAIIENCNEKVIEQKKSSNQQNTTKTESEIKQVLCENENEEKKRKKNIGNNILFVIGVIIICIILKPKNDELNLLQRKTRNEKKPLLHQNNNQTQLEVIQKRLEFLDNFIESQEKKFEKNLLHLRKEHDKEFETLNGNTTDISKMIEEERKEQQKDIVEKEKDALIRLKSSIKTIDKDHEKHFKFLAELLNFITMSELATNLHLLFRASEQEGPLAVKFHELCDGKGPTITIVRSEYKRLFGGYASISWNSDGDSYAPDSFLFSLDEETKHIILKNESDAIRGNKEYGPSFGASDLALSYTGELDDPTKPNWSNLGFTYSLPDGLLFQTDAAQSYLAGSYRFKVEEYEVFAVVMQDPKVKEESLMTQLKSLFKTIHQEHEKHFNYIVQLLNFKNLEQLLTNLRLLFRASEHNDSLAEKFHELCDGKGPTITIARSQYKKLFGGYAAISWNSDGDLYAPGSFLFSLDHQTKHTISKNENCALRGNKEYGPSFGGSDLALSYAGYLEDSSRPNWSDLGFTYSLPEGYIFQSDEAQSYLTGSYRFKTEEYEVFRVITD